MATSKTLTPTNVTIQIPAFTDAPDQRVNSNCIDKEADAINALNSKITPQSNDIGGGCKFTVLGKMRILSFNNNSGSLTTDGIQLPETALFGVCVPCIYYNGSSNVEGMLYVSGNHVYVTNNTLNAQSGSYIRGQLVYFVA